MMDAHAVTHGREDRSLDGTHYWNRRVFQEPSTLNLTPYPRV